MLAGDTDHGVPDEHGKLLGNALIQPIEARLTQSVVGPKRISQI